jgi:DNA-directed RNA polymerase subunit beta
MSISEVSNVLPTTHSVPTQPLSNFYNRCLRKWVRRSFGRLGTAIEIPNLLSIQLDSYQQFLQKDIPLELRENTGLHEVLQSFFPLEGNGELKARLEYVDYHIGEPTFEIDECLLRGLTYSAPLRAKMRLVIFDSEAGESRKVREIKEQEVYIGEIPLMTDTGGVIINGTNRIVISQIYRSPGVLFEQDKKSVSGKVLYTARVIPYLGSWLVFEFDSKDNLFVKVDRYRKLPATVLLHAFGCSTEEILDIFFEHNTFTIKDNIIRWKLIPDRLWGEIAAFDIKDNQGAVLVAQGQRIVPRHINSIKESGLKELVVPIEYLAGKVLAKPIIDKATGEILGEVNTELTIETLTHYLERGVTQIELVHTNEFNSGNYISKTLSIDPVRTRSEALVEIYRCIRPGELPSVEVAENLFKNFLFGSLERYDLSDIGRMKLNVRLGRTSVEELSHLSKEEIGLLHKEDIIDVLKELIAIRDGKSKVDAVDHLGNRRIRSVGEMAKNQFRSGLVRLERSIKEGLSKPEVVEAMPQDLINAKPVMAALKEFYSGALSQYADETNRLSYLAHGRRTTVSGQGGVPRERASAELRDVDATHFGRLCPIETPEGANIGLINSLALLAKPDKYGFLVTPYRKVIGSKVTKDIEYLSAITEGNYVIAQANSTVDAEDRLVGPLVSARSQGEPILVTADKVQYMDVSPAQMVSAAAALIPFLEHDDVNRALMGSNMQRQAVPLLRPEKPLVGTGMEQKVALDSGTVIVAKRKGIVDSVDAGRIVVRVEDENLLEKGTGVDIYNLKKYRRTNQSTCDSQRPIVKQGDQVEVGDILADGASSDMGELALGQNLRVAFMTWEGFNFEDSVILSDRLVKQGKLQSVHIEDLVCIARDTVLGPEEITADIPNVSPHMLANLDESGIIRIGAFIRPGDIIVGKVTPKGEVQLTPEEKLLRAIFGEKTSDVKDSSLRASGDISGKVIDVAVFTREGLEKDARAKEIEKALLAKFKHDLDDEFRIRSQDIYKRAKAILLGATVKAGPKKLKANNTISEDYLDNLSQEQWFSIELQDASLNDKLFELREHIVRGRAALQEKYQRQQEKLLQGDELTPGVLKVVKVRVAVTRCIQAGDKIAGRHGNKGVISTIVPVEDMPYMEDGTPIDVILNPLGVPSRMNVGQLLEAHLGWAAKALGDKLGRMLDSQAPVTEIRELLNAIYSSGNARQRTQPIHTLDNEEIINLAQHLRHGVPMATPVFDGASEAEIQRLLGLADLPLSGQVNLYDGKTGRLFDRPITVGYMYILKLHHLVDDKMHARSTGSYSLVTQQPLGGKAQFGGQRFGEMEVWALQGYGAAYNLREMFTIKSDDVTGRIESYKDIVDGKPIEITGTPESFNVLMKEMLALGLDVGLESKGSEEE